MGGGGRGVEAPLPDPARLEALLRERFPSADTRALRVEEAEPRRVRLRFRPGAEHLRPGGTVAGPALMMLADVATVLALLATRGAEADGVTASLSIHFLRRPAPRDLLAEARLVKLGRRSAVAQVTLWSEGEEEPVALATVAYALPPSHQTRSGE